MNEHEITPIESAGEPPICSVECPQYVGWINDGSSIDCLLCRVRDCGEVCVPAVLRMAAELEQAKAVIEKLPICADTGKPIICGSVIYSTDMCGQSISGPMAGFNFCTEDGQEAEVFVGDTRRGGYWCVPMSECYSTREAAEAAKEGE